MTSKRIVMSFLAMTLLAVMTPSAWATGVGDITPMAIIPEPASGVLLAIGALMILPRRRQR